MRLVRAEQRGYTRSVKRHARVFQKLIAAFYDEDAFEVFMCRIVPWDLSRGITSIVAGCAHLTWPLWWRYHIFLGICRLQRYWKVVKHPPASAPLLEAVKDRTTREAVRSVLERLTGQKAAPETATQPPAGATGAAPKSN